MRLKKSGFHRLQFGLPGVLALVLSSGACLTPESESPSSKVDSDTPVSDPAIVEDGGLVDGDGVPATGASASPSPSASSAAVDSLLSPVAPSPSPSLSPDAPGPAEAQVSPSPSAAPVAVLPSPGGVIPGASPSASPSATPTPRVFETRTLDHFRTSPTDRFVVDVEHVSEGHPYIGIRTPTEVFPQPHTGSHLHYAVASWPRGGTAPENYPAIYAVEDGKITGLNRWVGLNASGDSSTCRDLRSYSNGQYGACDNHPDERCGDIRPEYLQCPAGNPDMTACTSTLPCTVNYQHYKYDMRLQIATDNGSVVNFIYSIEPFVVPRDPVTQELLPRFYESFIRVAPGQIVRKGDIIAYHYLKADEPNASGAHVHFNISRSGRFISPSIFAGSVIDALKLRWGGRGFLPGARPVCMGMFLGPLEVPFASLDPEADGADCL